MSTRNGSLKTLASTQMIFQFQPQDIVVNSFKFWATFYANRQIDKLDRKSNCVTSKINNTCSKWSVMAFTLWALLEAGLLIVNAICVLHEQRFLAKGKFCDSIKPRNYSKPFLAFFNSYKFLASFLLISLSWMGIK